MGRHRDLLAANNNLLSYRTDLRWTLSRAGLENISFRKEV